MNNNIKVKLIDNSKHNDSNVAKYSISYSAKMMEISQASYKILSALKKYHDIIIEVTSLYLGLNEEGNKELLSQLSQVYNNTGIEYMNKKVKQSAKKTFLSFGREEKKYEGFELFAFIPDEKWSTEEFEKVRPIVGARYYILNKDYKHDLSEFLNMELEERLPFCEMVIYDNVSIASMGINSDVLNKGNIIELLDNIN